MHDQIRPNVSLPCDPNPGREVGESSLSLSLLISALLLSDEDSAEDWHQLLRAEIFDPNALLGRPLQCNLK